MLAYIVTLRVYILTYMVCNQGLIVLGFSFSMQQISPIWTDAGKRAY